MTIKPIIFLCLIVASTTFITTQIVKRENAQNTFHEPTREKLFNYWIKDNINTRNQLLTELRARDLKAYHRLVTWNTDWSRNQAALTNQYSRFTDKLFSLYFLAQKMNWHDLERGSFRLLKEVAGQHFKYSSNFDRYQTRLANLAKISQDENSSAIITKLSTILTGLQRTVQEQQQLQDLKGHLNPYLLRSSLNKNKTFPWPEISGLAAAQMLAGLLLIWGISARRTKETTSSMTSENASIEDVNLTEIIEDALSDLSPIFQSKNLQVIFEDSTEYVVKENHKRLSRTLNALISDIALAVAPRAKDKTLFLQLVKEKNSVVLNAKIKDVCLSQAVLVDPYTGNQSNARCLEESLEAFEKVTSGKVSIENLYDPNDKELSSIINVSFQA